MSKKLTKSKFKLALECPTKLYYIDKPEYANQKTENSFLKALADGGAQVEALARCYYPEGVQINEEDNNYALARTKELMLKESVILFEAAIQFEQFFMRTDILIKNYDHLKLIEVKAKSFSKNTISKIVKKNNTISTEWKSYVADVAFQKWLLQKAYPNYRISTYLMLVDKDSLCPTDGLNQKFLLEKNKLGKVRVNVSKSLTTEDLSIRILKEVNIDDYIDKIWSERNEDGLTYKEQFQEFSKLYFQNKKFKATPKKECSTCQFKTKPEDEKAGLKSGFKECWRESLHYTEADFKDATVLDLWAYLKKDQCLKSGLIKLKDFDETDLPSKNDGRPGLSRTERQWLQIEKVKNADNQVWLDKQGLKDEIASWNYPLHFIDFETAMLPIPFKKDTHPYQGIVFQFSHHILDEKGKVVHYGEYLNTQPGVDPSIDFIRALKKDLENNKGTILRYSSHENTYLNIILRQIESLSSPLPDKEELCTFIKSITKSPSDSHDKWSGERCMVDLLELVKRFYYDPITDGSNSIKKILPSILFRSQFLQEKYSKPIYGTVNGIPSKNFNDQKWVVFDQEKIKDPYLLLDPINKEAPDEKIELLFDGDQLKEGGAATIAYAKLQCTHMSDFERNELRKALLKYCELDTLAMVMIVEAWLDILK